MGRIILCGNDLAGTPYVFKLSGTKVYSIEELCYYVYCNIYEISEDVFNETMVEWLRNEVRMPTLADKIQSMMEAKSGLKDVVISLFCSCDYYSEEEIKQVVGIVDEISRKPYYGRQKIKADNLIKYKKYAKAIKEYEKLLYGGMAMNLSPEEYGDVLHNLSVAYIHVDRLEEAVKGFKSAYMRNKKKETLEQYFYALLLSGRETEIEKEMVNMEQDEGKMDDYKEKMENYRKEAEGMEELKRLRYEWKNTNSMDLETVPENISRYILEWKQKYREYLNT